jgi:hypothetical protein
LCGSRAEEGRMSAIRCLEFKVACAPTEGSCEECVLRAFALAREVRRVRVEARRRERADEIRAVSGGGVDAL